jgi:hypothetical protein
MNSVTLDVPFENARDADIALNALNVDGVRRILEISVLERVCLRWSSKHFCQKNL